MQPVRDDHYSIARSIHCRQAIAEQSAERGLSSALFTEVLRDGARELIEQAIHAELATLMAAFANEAQEDRRARWVRQGHLPEREVMTGIGPVPVKVPRVRDRSAEEDGVTFTPSILPRYLRKAKSVEELLPWLYLKGVSTGDFTEALAALLGANTKGLFAKTIMRLKADWWTDYEAWQKHDLGNRRCLYIWADGVYLKRRMAEEKQCILVIVGADEYSRKESLAMTDGFRESPPTPPETTLTSLALPGQGGQSTASYRGSAADWAPPRGARRAQIQSGRVLRRPMAGFYFAVDTGCQIASTPMR